MQSFPSRCNHAAKETSVGSKEYARDPMRTYRIAMKSSPGHPKKRRGDRAAGLLPIKMQRKSSIDSISAFISWTRPFPLPFYSALESKNSFLTIWGRDYSADPLLQRKKILYWNKCSFLWKISRSAPLNCCQTTIIRRLLKKIDIFSFLNMNYRVPMPWRHLNGNRFVFILTRGLQ